MKNHFLRIFLVVGLIITHLAFSFPIHSCPDCDKESQQYGLSDSNIDQACHSHSKEKAPSSSTCDHVNCSLKNANFNLASIDAIKTNPHSVVVDFKTFSTQYLSPKLISLNSKPFDTGPLFSKIPKRKIYCSYLI